MTDGGQLTADEIATPQDLSLFQQEILLVLAENGAQHGLGIKARLQELYGEEVNHGRLYPNLDDLADKGLLDKGQRDRRTNEYELTDRGIDLLRRDVQRRYLAVTNDGRDLWEVDA